MAFGFYATVLVHVVGLLVIASTFVLLLCVSLSAVFMVLAQQPFFGEADKRTFREMATQLFSPATLEMLNLSHLACLSLLLALVVLLTAAERALVSAKEWIRREAMLPPDDVIKAYTGFTYDTALAACQLSHSEQALVAPGAKPQESARREQAGKKHR